MVLCHLDTARIVSDCLVSKPGVHCLDGWLTWQGSAQCGWATSGLMGWGAKWEQAEQAWRASQKAASLCGLCLSSGLQTPALTSLGGGLQAVKYNNRFSLQVALGSHCTGAAIESLIRQFIKQCCSISQKGLDPFLFSFVCLSKKTELCFFRHIFSVSKFSQAEHDY